MWRRSNPTTGAVAFVGLAADQPPGFNSGQMISASRELMVLACADHMCEGLVTGAYSTPTGGSQYMRRASRDARLSSRIVPSVGHTRIFPFDNTAAESWNAIFNKGSSTCLHGRASRT
jgi:hypothetical protein